MTANTSSLYVVSACDICYPGGPDFDITFVGKTGGAVKRWARKNPLIPNGEFPARKLSSYDFIEIFKLTPGQKVETVELIQTIGGQRFEQWLEGNKDDPPKS